MVARLVTPRPGGNSHELRTGLSRLSTPLLPPSKTGKSLGDAASTDYAGAIDLRDRRGTRLGGLGAAKRVALLVYLAMDGGLVRATVCWPCSGPESTRRTRRNSCRGLHQLRHALGAT